MRWGGRKRVSKHKAVYVVGVVPCTERAEEVIDRSFFADKQL